MADDIVFRRATLADYDAVLDIAPDIFQGMDYIMNQLKTLMSSGEYYAYLAELNGKTIAFVMCSIQLEGRKLCLKAGRVRAEWQGQGIYGKLLAYQLQDMKKNYPSLEVEEFNTNDANVSVKKLYKSDQYKQFGTRAFLNYRFKAVHHSDPGDLLKVQDIGIDGIRNVLMDKTRSDVIFQTRIFIIWEMYDPAMSEMSYISKLDPDVMATVNKENEITALSTMGSFRTITGRFYVIQFHFAETTPISSATKMVASLVYSHVAKISEIGEEDILCLSANESFRDILSAAAEQLGFTKIDQFATTHIAFNRKLD